MKADILTAAGHKSNILTVQYSSCSACTTTCTAAAAVVQVQLYFVVLQAIKAFLHDMGINWANLQQNEALVDAIVAYHTVLGSGARPRTRGSNASGRIVAMTVAEPYKLLIKKVRALQASIVVR